MAEVDRDGSVSLTEETPEQALRAAVDLHGPALFYEKASLGAFLERRCPSAVPDIAMLLRGLEAQVPQALVAARSGAALQDAIRRLEDGLERSGQNAYAAAWVVETWLRALRLVPATGSPGVAGNSTAPAGPAPRTGSSPAMTGFAESTAVTADDAAPPAAAVPEWAAEERRSSDARWTLLAAIVLAAVVAAALALRNAGPPASESRDAAAAVRPIENPRPPPVAERVPAETSTPAPVTTTSAAAAPMVAAATAALPEIVDVAGDEPLVGDGRPHALHLALANARADVRTVESRFVDGDAVLRTQAGTTAIPAAGGVAAIRVPAGTIALRTTRPVEASFEFVVVTADGRRSKPYVKDLVIAPLPPEPPTIADVVLPADVAVGSAFTVAVGVRPGDKAVASLEQTIVDPTGKGHADVRTIDAATLKRTDDGRLAVPMRASRVPSTLTMDLVLIDEDGLRSEAKRIVVPVTADAGSTAAALSSSGAASGAGCTPASCGEVVAVREIDDPTFENKLADAFAFGAKPRSAARKVYEVAVKTDDGTTRTVRQPSGARVGSRVRLAGGRTADLDPAR